MSFAYLIPESPENLLDYFALVADLPYAMLLDSAAADVTASTGLALVTAEAVALMKKPRLYSKAYPGQSRMGKSSSFRISMAIAGTYLVQRRMLTPATKPASGNVKIYASNET